jgi:4-hydroxy-2-oxoheptanedioate aldolase
MVGAGTSGYVEALNEIVIVLMIEKKTAVEQLEDILSVNGIDMINWGGADYSMSVGRPGEWHSPEVKAVERKVIQTCLRKGIPPRAEINSIDDAKYYIDMGVRHFCIGTDLFILYDWMKTNGKKMRELLS